MVAVDVGVARVILRAGAPRFVTPHEADAIAGAGIDNLARIDALPITARLSLRTVAVGSATGWLHGNY